MLGEGEAQLGGDRSAPVTPLRTEALVSQDVMHQVEHAVGHVRDREAPLARAKRQAVTGERRSDDGEGVASVAAKSGRVGQARNDLEKFEHRTGPAMHQE